MHARRLVPLLLVALVLPTAASASQGALLEAPVDLSQPAYQAQAGQLELVDGTQPLVIANPTGSLEVWTYRVPCVQRSQDSCLDANADTNRRTIDLDGGSVTLGPRQGMSYAVYIDLDDGALRLFGDQGALDVRSETQNHTLYGSNNFGAEAPASFNRVTRERGAVAQAGSGTQLASDGSYVLRTAGATVDLVVPDGENQELVTGWSWQEADDQGFSWERQLQLIRLANTGELTTDWDGQAKATPNLPLAVEAETAQARILEGSLLGNDAGDQRQSFEDVQLLVTGVQAASQAQGGQQGTSGQPAALEVQQGAPAPNTPDPTEDQVSDTTLYGGGAAVLLGLAAVAYYWPRISWFATALVLPMYSRIEKSDLLDNEIREELYETVQEDPGIHAHALSEALDIGWGTTVYHLRRLERNGMVTSEKRGRYRRFFPAAGYVARTREVLSVLQNDTTNDIARYILRNPETNQKGICEALDISPSLANWHINRLMDAELVERERRGRTVHYTPGTAWDEIGDAVDLAA